MAKTKNDPFRQALLEAVDEGLLTLGESGRKAIYFHLQNLYSVKKEDVPDEPSAFVEGLTKIFGSGAQMIEKAIMKSVYRKLGLEYSERKGCDFATYLEEAKLAIEQG